MPRLRKETIRWQDRSDRWQSHNVVINVSSQGLFYVSLKDELDSLTRAFYQFSTKRDCIGYEVNRDVVWATSSTDTGLVNGLRDFFRAYYDPEISEELVIRYLIGSKTAYATNKEGRIYPNASFPGTSWNKDDDRFGVGSHVKFAERRGAIYAGFVVSATAKVLKKITYDYGSHKKIDYKRWYGPGNNHHEKEHPAARLNMWLSAVPEEADEMPYTDEAAMFFYSIMEGMVNMAQRIREMTGSQEKLLELIANKTPLLESNK